MSSEGEAPREQESISQPNQLHLIATEAKLQGRHDSRCERTRAYLENRKRSRVVSQLHCKLTLIRSWMYGVKDSDSYACVYLYESDRCPVKYASVAH